MEYLFPREKAYYVALQENAFRAGEAAEILDFGFYHLPGGPKLCFQIRFTDGAEDVVLADNSNNYAVISQTDFSANRIPRPR